MPYLRSLFFILCLGMNWGALAQEKKVVTVGYLEFPPSTYTSRSGAARGTEIRLCRTLLSNAGYTAVFKALPSARLYAQLIAGDIDLWIGTPNKPELQGHTLESNRIISEVTLAVFYRPQAQAPLLPDDLKNKQVIVIGGYSYWPPVSQWLTDPTLGLKQARTSQHASAIEMLMRKRGDYLFDYVEPMLDTQKRLGVPAQNLPYIKVHSTPLSFIISKRSRYAEQLLADIDRQFDLYNAAHLLPDDKQ